MDHNFQDLLNIAFALGLPWAAGYVGVSLLIGKKALDKLTHMALAFGLGMGLITHYMLILGMLDVPITKSTISLGIAMLTTVLLYLSTKMNRTTDKEQSFNKNTYNKIDPIFIGLSMYVFFYVIYSFWCSLNIPLCAWDELESIGLKAKIFYDEGSY